MRNKECLDRLTAHYFKSSTLIFELGLDATTVSIYCFMSSRSAEFSPSIRYLSEKLKLGRRTIKNSIDNLIAFNIIRLDTSRGIGYSDIYEFVDPEEWRISATS